MPSVARSAQSRLGAEHSSICPYSAMAMIANTVKPNAMAAIGYGISIVARLPLTVPVWVSNSPDSHAAAEG